MVTDFLGIVGEWLTGFFGLVGDTITSAISLIYVADTGFTLVGTLMLFGLAVGLVYFGINFVVKLVKK